MTCLTPETLAALAAGRLPPRERTLAEAHVAHCTDCSEVLGDVLRMADEGVVEAAPSAAPRNAIYWGWRRNLMAAAASVVLVAGLYGAWQWRSPARQLDRAVAQLAQSVGTARSIEARLNGGFVWGPPPVTTRGEEAAPLPFDAQQATLNIRRLASESPSARALGATGVASLVAGDIDAAVSALEAAAAREDADAGVWGDLAAAHVERWRRTREAADAAAALDAAERALLLAPADPIARFNQALAVEALGLRDQALTRWRAYLEVDGTSQWAAEARERLARLEREPPFSERATPVAPDGLYASLSGPRRLCADRAAVLLSDSRTAFDASRLTEAETLARLAAPQLVCAGLPQADAHAQLAWTLFFQNRPADARLLVDRVLATGSGVSPLGRGQAEYIRALGHVRQGRYSEADAGYERAIGAFRDAGDPEFEAAARVLRSEVGRNRTDRSAAWSGLVPAFDALPQLGPRRRHLTFHNAIATAEWFGLPGAARFFANALVDVNASTGDPVIEVGALLQSVRVHVTLDRYAEAHALLDRASARIVAISETSMRDQYATEIDVMTAHVLAGTDATRARAAYDRIIDAFVPAERPLRRALMLLERGRLFARAGESGAAERDWLEGAALFEDPRPELRDEQWRVDSRSELWELFRELIQVNDADPLEGLTIAERSRGRALLDARARGAHVAPVSGADIHTWLPADVIVVVYAVLDDGLRRWDVTRDGVTLSREPVSPAGLAEQVDTFVRDVAAGRVGGGGALSRWLLPTGLSAARTPRVVFLPDGPLYRVPFSALILPGGSADTPRLVIDEFVPLVAPSLSVLRDAGRLRVTPTRPLLVASGDAHPREGLPALPGVGPEVDAVRAGYADAQLLRGSAATARVVLEAMPRADLIHFAGHVVTDAATPSRSRLLLFPGRDEATLSFADLRGVSLVPGATVVLSACDGARGRVFRGEGAVGLPFVFLANGASTVVAALWQVDDSAPATFWVEVHRRLRAGTSTDVALAESQRELRRAGVSSTIWAAFTVVGGLHAS